MRARVTISPSSRTVVSDSSSSTTASTSSAYFFCGAWARMRSQSGVPAPATDTPQPTSSTIANALIVVLGMGAASLQNRLLFIAGLYFPEKVFECRVVGQTEDEPAHHQNSLRSHQRSVALGKSAIVSPRRLHVLGRRQALHRDSGTDFDADVVPCHECIREVDRILALRMLEGIALFDPEKRRRQNQSLADH